MPSPVLPTQPQRSAARAYLAVATAALLVQAIITAGLWQADPMISRPGLDAALYRELSIRSYFGDRPHWHAQLYPWLIGVFGLGHAQVVAAQVVLAALTTANLWRLARSIHGARVAAASAALWIAFGPAVFHQALALPTGLGLFLFSCGLNGALAPASPRAPILAGLAFGAATLVRPELSVPSVFALARWMRAPVCSRHRRWLPPLAFGLMLLPTCLHNARLGAGFAVASNGPVNLWLANASEGTVGFRPPGDAWRTPHGQEQAAQVIAGDAHADAPFLRLTVSTIASDVDGWLKLVAAKLAALAGSYEHGANHLYSVAQSLCGVLRLLPVNAAALLLLATVGAWSHRKERETVSLSLVAASVFAVCVVFYPYGRLRLVGLYALTPIAASALFQLTAWSRTHRSLFLLAFVALCADGYRVRDTLEARQLEAQDWSNCAASAPKSRADFLRRALSRDPASVDAMLQVAWMDMDRGSPAAALRALSECVDLTAQTANLRVVHAYAVAYLRAQPRIEPDLRALAGYLRRSLGMPDQSGNPGAVALILASIVIDYPHLAVASNEAERLLRTARHEPATKALADRLGPAR